MRLDIQGLGILLYSPFAAAHIGRGEDYLEGHYGTPAQVIPHVVNGGLVGFATGSPGRFILRFHHGSPAHQPCRSQEYGLRLGLEVRDHRLCVRDLYDVLEWLPECPEAQTLEMPDGHYEVTLCSALPASGVLGDDQLIDVFLRATPALPVLRYDGIPTLDA